MSTINDSIMKIDDKKIGDLFSSFLSSMISPTLGALSKKEMEIRIFFELQRIGYISDNPSIYELISKLKITNTKARSLLYEVNLRQFNEQEIDQLLLSVLKSPAFSKEGKDICINVDNPVLIDKIKAILNEKGSILDGTFSPTLVKLSQEGFAAIIEYFAGEKLRKHLIKVNLIDSDTKKIVKNISKIIDAATGISISEIFESLIDLKDNSVKWIENAVKTTPDQKKIKNKVK